MNAVELTRDLVRIDTVNPQSAERPAAERLGQLLVEAGYSVATHEFAAGRASLVARREGPGLPICFAGHLDTVPLGAAPWTRDPFGGELDGGKLYGRGSSDMKSGVAAMVAAALRLAKTPLHKAGITLVLVAGEETGCEGAAHLAKVPGALGHAGALVVGEPTGNRPVIGHKGAFLWHRFPKFVIGFLVISALATAGAFDKAQSADLANLSRWAFLLTFAGVGLRTNIHDLTKQGWRPLVVGVVGECAIAAITLLLVLLASRSASF